MDIVLMKKRLGGLLVGASTFTDFTRGLTWLSDNTRVSADAFFDVSVIGSRQIENLDGTLVTRGDNELSRSTKGEFVFGASENKLLYSQEFDNAVWDKSTGISVVANSVIAPDGTFTADTLPPTIGGSFVEVSQNIVSSAGEHSIGSFYVEYAGFQYIQIISPGSRQGSYFVNFDIINGAVTLASVATSVDLTYSIHPVGNGWRISVSVKTLSTGFCRYAINFIKTPTTARGVDEGDFNGTDGLILWGGQFEASQVLTPYKKTTASASAVSAEVVTVPTVDLGFGATEGMIVIDAKLFNSYEEDSGFRYLFTMSDGTSDNRLYLFRDNSSNLVRLSHRVAGVSALLTLTDINVNTDQKIAVGWSGNTIYVVVDGGAPQTITTQNGLDLDPQDDFALMSSWDGGGQVNNIIRSIITLPEWNLAKAQGLTL